ncbi:MAG: murein L,D-transpeptidase family protein [Hyphomicrobiaceae bacterium]
MRLPLTSLLLILGVASAVAIAIDLPAHYRQGLDGWRMGTERATLRARYKQGLPLAGTPDLTKLKERLASAKASLGAPVLVRIFKRESELELWLKTGDRFKLFATYPICRWAGELGPKISRGDRQAPEGFYTVAKHQLNPASRWHRSFNIGYPNLLDRQHGRTGDYIMVHGGCSSAGCFAVTNEVVDEIWRIVTAALGKGQKRFQVQSFPFRMTEANLALYEGHRWQAFWQDLKAGYDLFERTGVPPAVGVCDGRYTFAAGKAGGDGSAAIEKGCMSTVASAAQGQG